MPIKGPPEAESAPAGGSDGPEIEVTPEMVQAGVNHLMEWEGISPPASLVEGVFLAMWRLSSER